MSALRAKISQLAWIAPGLICAALALLTWREASLCDSGGCAVGSTIGLVVLLVVWPVAAVLCARASAYLQARGKLRLGSFVLLVAAAFTLPATPLIVVALFSEFLVSELVSFGAFAFILGGAIASAWWLLKHGATLSPQGALPPNTSFERTREG